MKSSRAISAFRSPRRRAVTTSASRPERPRAQRCGRRSAGRRGPSGRPGVPVHLAAGRQLEKLGEKRLEKSEAEPLGLRPGARGAAEKDELPFDEGRAAERQLQAAGRVRRAGGAPDGAGRGEALAVEAPAVPEPLRAEDHLHLHGVRVEDRPDRFQDAGQVPVVRGSERRGRGGGACHVSSCPRIVRRDRPFKS